MVICAVLAQRPSGRLVRLKGIRTLSEGESKIPFAWPSLQLACLSFRGEAAKKQHVPGKATEKEGTVELQGDKVPIIIM